jgi:tetratricopeptide (TPR) repeat protein
MITLRVFDSSAEAAIAKSVLDDHGISSSLADEATHLYAGAPGAIPVRLLVREDQAEDALRILDAPGPALPDDFEPATDEEPVEEKPPEVAVELRNLQRTVRRLVVVSAVLFFVLFCFVAYLLTERPTYVDRLWRNFSLALRNSDLERARRIAQNAVKQYPRAYWSHQWLAMVNQKEKDFAGAEAEYQRAYDLLPSEEIRKDLQKVRIEKQSHGPAATASPTP